MRCKTPTSVRYLWLAWLPFAAACTDGVDLVPRPANGAYRIEVRERSIDCVGPAIMPYFEALDEAALWPIRFREYSGNAVTLASPLEPSPGVVAIVRFDAVELSLAYTFFGDLSGGNTLRAKDGVFSDDVPADTCSASLSQSLDITGVVDDYWFGHYNLRISAIDFCVGFANCTSTSDVSAERIATAEGVATP